MEGPLAESDSAVEAAELLEEEEDVVAELEVAGLAVLETEEVVVT